MAAFSATKTWSLEADIAAVERILASPDQPLTARLLKSFDQWACRHTGRLTRVISCVTTSNPHLPGAITTQDIHRHQT